MSKVETLPERGIWGAVSVLRFVWEAFSNRPALLLPSAHEGLSDRWRAFKAVLDGWAVLVERCPEAVESRVEGLGFPHERAVTAYGLWVDLLVDSSPGVRRTLAGVSGSVEELFRVLLQAPGSPGVWVIDLSWVYAGLGGPVVLSGRTQEWMVAHYEEWLRETPAGLVRAFKRHPKAREWGLAALEQQRSGVFEDRQWVLALREQYLGTEDGDQLYWDVFEVMRPMFAGRVMKDCTVHEFVANALSARKFSVDGRQVLGYLVEHFGPKELVADVSGGSGVVRPYFTAKLGLTHPYEVMRQVYNRVSGLPKGSDLKPWLSLLTLMEFYLGWSDEWYTQWRLATAVAIAKIQEGELWVALVKQSPKLIKDLEQALPWLFEGQARHLLLSMHYGPERLVRCAKYVRKNYPGVYELLTK